MAALYDRDVQAKALKNNSVLLLHCITTERKEIVMGNFSIIGVRLRVAHVSFPSSIGERKAVFVPDNTEPDEPIGSMTLDPPQLIAVKTSCNVRVSQFFSLKFYNSSD